jgi:hypothetical protein
LIVANQAGAAFKDNAMIESFWSRMQVELLDRQRWSTRIELASAIFGGLPNPDRARRQHRGAAPVCNVA